MKPANSLLEEYLKHRSNKELDKIWKHIILLNELFDKQQKLVERIIVLIEQSK